MALIDTTLRDGEQAPGVYFPFSAKLIIAHLLTELGICEIEVRSPVHDPQESISLKTLLHAQPQTQWLVWCRARREDLEAAAKIGASRVHIAYPTSDIQLATIRSNWQETFARMEPVVLEAIDTFDFVSVGAQDASRTPTERLVQYAQALESWGVKRMRIADTLGIMTPDKVTQLIHTLRSYVPRLDLEFHGHNDFGMATANSYAALEAGANFASATVLGIGERSGNASLEQLVMLFIRNYPALAHNLHSEVITSLCATVSKLAHKDIAPQQPLVGSDAIRHQSGIHIAGMLQNPASYQPFAPTLIGRGAPEFLVGALIGRHGLLFVLESQGVIPTSKELDVLIGIVKDRVRSNGNNLSFADVTQLYLQHC